jgi:hypothetical protein
LCANIALASCPATAIVSISNWNFSQVSVEVDLSRVVSIIVVNSTPQRLELLFGHIGCRPSPQVIGGDGADVADGATELFGFEESAFGDHGPGRLHLPTFGGIGFARSQIGCSAGVSFP